MPAHGSMISNPVLPGFRPDPSILRVGADYYLATSTFEWFPGVGLHHSRDLVNWRPIGAALTETRLLDLRGVADSAGVWAPSLSHHAGRFWLVYSIVRHVGTAFKDVDNYLVTAEDIAGPWSEPVFLNSSGFDASMFHDEDGRHWVVNVEWDHRPDHPSFGGIVLQEYDAAAGRMTGPVTTIARKETLIEGPNLYRRDGWYHLMLAEGGTGWNHGISMARSRRLTGPYEFDPEPDVLTSRHDPGLPLQKAGHGELVATPDGQWYLAHLASRPEKSPDGEPRCVLGRETCLQPVTWTPDGWLRLADGTTTAAVTVPAPAGLPAHPWPAEPARDDFDSPALSVEWSSLRVPAEATWATLHERPGFLRLYGRQSQHSLFDQSLLARRVTHRRVTAATRLEFGPDRFSQSAGLIAWYDTSTYYYLRVTHHERLGRVIGLVINDDGAYSEPADTVLPCGDWPQLHLRARLNGSVLVMEAAPAEGAWRQIGPDLDATRLSDDYGSRLRFTGAFIGLCAQDLSGTRTPADFDWFDWATGD
ncbi:glycoside hydrolase family 43 protein [Streptomyces litchfieldiae]|uniref:Glycoside hydrolase family 43 protein n=1 Tax=Streptomyces litchfieldiae TaxID=3075543 RepID=A0ABU2MIT5_9ACTN|nr:glycoside hydrolase family 43 protein [Streptomyces sp. DSM 44938]MDT0341510.1 glycoside hydrolase family 43 protein [Streptomyces sp. DSM 44938]